MRWQRIRHAINLLGGIAIGLAVAFFIVGNVNPTDVHWRIPTAHGSLLDWSFKGISLWFVGIVPLLVGLAAGYLYQTPARMHHVREHMRHRHRVHELEHELKELRGSFDKLLMMPEDGRPAISATIIPVIEQRTAVSEDELERDPRLPDEPAAVELLASKPITEEDHAPVSEAHRAAEPGKPRRRFFGRLRAEVAEIKLPAAIPTTVVAAPRRNAKAANGQAKPATPAAARPAVKSTPRPVRKAAARKPA